MKVLIAYASKTGFTKGIAEFIGERLRLQGLHVDVRDFDAVESAASYDAFVIGSAVYMFHWLKQAKRFVSNNRALLSQRPVWIFSSGPVGTKATDAQGRDLREVSGPKEVEEIRDAIKPRDHRVFFGGLDGTRLAGTMGFAYRMVRRSQTARESMPEGDFRDWKEIEAWALGIANALKIQSVQAS
jgi:menaquinone-dependent protoporphyrinogen oxidase